MKPNIEHLIAKAAADVGARNKRAGVIKTLIGPTDEEIHALVTKIKEHLEQKQSTDYRSTLRGAKARERVSVVALCLGRSFETLEKAGYFDKLRRILKEYSVTVEGVSVNFWTVSLDKTSNVAEKPDELGETTLEKTAKVSPVFSGALDREAMAEALKAVRDRQGLSINHAAELAGVDRKDIQRIENGTATLDKAASVLTELGFPPEMSVPAGA